MIGIEYTGKMRLKRYWWKGTKVLFWELRFQNPDSNPAYRMESVNN